MSLRGKRGLREKEVECVTVLKSSTVSLHASPSSLLATSTEEALTYQWQHEEGMLNSHDLTLPFTLAPLAL